MTQIESILKWVSLRFSKNVMLHSYEKSIYSQNGEDGVIEAIFKVIGTDSKYFVEFGVQDGIECNTRYLKENKKWHGLLMDGEGKKKRNIKKEWVTRENINDLFKKYKVPKNLDLLSIDIDSNDIWVWESLSREYRPRLVICEYNSSLPYNEPLTIPYNPKQIWQEDSYFGASLLAFCILARHKDYTLVYCDKNGINAFFVRNDLLGRLHVPTFAEAYRVTGYGNQDTSGIARTGHKLSAQKMIRYDYHSDNMIDIIGQ